MAGFAGARPHLPGGRKAIPAAFRYAAAVSRRTPVARWMRRRDHPSRPNAMTCCLFCSLKALLTSSEGIALALEFNVLDEELSLAGSQVIMYGRFWVFTEARRLCLPSFWALRAIPMRRGFAVGSGGTPPIDCTQAAAEPAVLITPPTRARSVPGFEM